MRRTLLFSILLLGAVVFGYSLSQSGVLENLPLEGLQQIGLGGRGEEAAPPLTAPPVQRSGETVRIASFNIQVFGESKSNKPQVMEYLAQIVRQYDIVAIQEIRSKNQDIIPSFVELLNATGRDYEFVISPRLGRTVSKEQYVFIFDSASIEADLSNFYMVDDPDDLLHREPYVGFFRVRGPEISEAFTFQLVNIHTDPDETDQELDALGDVFIAVQNDGLEEDDVIVLGDLNVDSRHLGALGQVPGITWVISGTPTNTRGNKSYDNIVFHQRATNEFTGRAGVHDYLREFNLSMDEALKISDHLPVWAEFSIYEDGVPGRVASRPE